MVKFNFNHNQEQFEAWNFLVKNCKHSRLFLFENKNKSQIMLRIGIRSKITNVKRSEELEIYDLVEYPIVTEFINVDFLELHKRIEEILPYIIYFTYTDKISPLSVRKGEHKGKYIPDRMSDFGIFLHSDFDQFLNTYQDFFVSLDNILGEIEKDFEQYEENNNHIFDILKKYECGISGNFLNYESPFELPEKCYMRNGLILKSEIQIFLILICTRGFLN